MKTKIKTKLTAIIVCFCFVSGILFPYNSYASVDNIGKGISKAKTEFSIPSSIGKITSSGYYGSDEVIINIQDLHCHAEVQKNIYKIIEFLDKKYAVEHVFLEGASGDIDTSLLTELTGSDMGKSTVETLLESGYLNGTEYYAAINKKEMFIKGIEDKNLYNRNIELLNKIISVKPEVNEICNTLLSEMKPVKREYGSREVRQLDRLVLKFEKKRISAEKYYTKLIEMAKRHGMDMSKYPSLKAYNDFLKSSGKINNEKVTRELKIFFSELKNNIPYGKYSALLEKSNSFTSIEDISNELIYYAHEYQICENKKLFQLKKFFNYLEFNNTVNPVNFTYEEKNFKEELYIKLGRTKYEQEVLFLYDFIPSIQGYFTANITAQDLSVFEDNFKRFTRSWCSYFPENTAKRLNPYIEMLSEYHNNNLKRDMVFGDIIISGHNSGKISGISGYKALLEIGNSLNGKNIKVVVTGGFHSKGLEKIFNDNKVSYIVIMPKVTSNLEEAYDIYLNIMKSYSSIAKAMINIKPLMAESLNESLPKVIGSAFKNLKNADIAEMLSRLNREEKKVWLYKFIQEEFIDKHNTGDVSVSEWKIDDFNEDKMTVTVKYKNKTNGLESVVQYAVSDNKIEEIGQTTRESDADISRQKDKTMSLFNNIFKDTKSAFYKFYTVFVAPILEESVFKVLPFIVAGALFTNPVSAASIAFVSFFSVILFTLAHNMADMSKNLNPYSSKRNTGYIFFSSILTTTIFFTVVALFPGMPIIAYGTSVLIHILNNALALSGRLNIPTLEVFNINKTIAEKEVAKNYGSMISALEGIESTIYGSFIREYWRLEGDLKDDFTSIVNIMKEAKDLNDEEKYRIVSEQVNSLYAFVLRDDVKQNNSFYSSFLADINKALGEVGENIKHLESGESVSEKLSVLINDVLVDDLIYYLKGLKYNNNEEKNNIIKNAVKELSDIPKDMPPVEKASIVLGLFESLFNLASNRERDTMHTKLMPLSIYIEKKSNKPLFLNYLKFFDREIQKIESRIKEFPDNIDNNDNMKSNFRVLMLDYFVFLYPFSVKYSLDLIKLLYKYGYIDNGEAPWSLRNITARYSGSKDYFLSIAQEGIDENALESLQKTINLLKEIKLSDNEAENLKNESIKELEYLTDKINITTMPLVEFQVRVLMEISRNSFGEERVLLFDALRPAAENFIAEKGRIEENTLKVVEKTSSQINIESPEFDSFVSFLGNIIVHTPLDSSTNKDIRSILYVMARQVYIQSIEESSQELKEKAFHMLRYISEIVPHSVEIKSLMFKDMGVNSETVEFYINSLRKSKIRNTNFAFPKNNSQIEYSDNVIDMLVQAADIMDLSRTIKSAFDSKTENGRKIANELIDRLFLIAEDTSININMRKRIAVMLGNAARLVHAESEERLNITKLNGLFRSLGMSCEVSFPYSYIKNREYTYSHTYNYTDLIRHLPEGILSSEEIVLTNPTFLNIKGITNKDNPEVNETIIEFERFQEVLKYNVLALTSSKALSKKSSLKDLNNILTYIMKMADALEKLNKEHGESAKKAIRKIYLNAEENGITSEFIGKQNILDKWTEEEIENIEGINTLINAIHQTSINDFKKKIKDLREMSASDVRTVTAMRNKNIEGLQEIEITGYDLSDKEEVNRDIKDFFIKLADGHVKIDDFIFKDDLLVWTTRLFIHSVDMFFNFSESDRGMTIYYNESGRRRGNAERVKYFSEVLRRLGFKVENDIELGSDIQGTCGLRAVLNKDAGLNDSTDLIEAAYKAIMLFKHSTNLDMELEDIYSTYEENTYNRIVFNYLIEKFLAGEIWYGYSYTPNGKTAFWDNKIAERIETVRFSDMKKTYNKILDYLGLPLIDKASHENLEQKDIDKYLNNEIERAFIEGRIAFNEEGILVPKSDDGVINDFVSSVEIENFDLIKQGRTLNLIGKRRFNYRTLGFVGSYMFVSGFYKTPMGIIFVKGLMNPSTGRIKYATTEYITEEGRQKLNNKELQDILNENGFNLTDDQDILGKREREYMFKAMKSGLQIIENPEIIATSMSDGKGTYVVGNITLDRENVKEGDILIASFTTPDDIKAIKTAKAIITISGGILSHAAITTREFGKPSVIIPNSVLMEDSLETGYYIQSGEIEEINGVSIKKVIEKRVSLKEGDRVLLNGENGSIIFFSGLDIEKLDKLQEIIDGNDVDGLKKFITEHEKDGDLGRFIEYVYFQAIGEKDHDNLMFALFDSSMPDNVKTKIKELNEGYIKGKVQDMEEALNVLDSVDNVNVAYGILNKLITKLGFIRTTEAREDIESIKKRVDEKQDEIKNGVYEHVNDMIKTARGYINKKKRSQSDIRRMFKIQHQAAVYNYFVSETETRQDLLDKKAELMEVISEIDNILRDYQNNYKSTGIESEIASFDGIYYEDINRFGSKTTELATMYRLLKGRVKVAVPMGVGVSTNVLDIYFEMIGKGLEYKKLSKEFEEAVKNKDAILAKETARKLRKLIDESKDVDGEAAIAKKKISEKILKSLKKNIKYSVRSSGVGEDGENKAFAGMGETMLNVKYDDIFASIEECWKSFYADRSIEYMLKSGKTVKPAVLIQEMVNAEKSGVIFSRNKYGDIIIGAVYGLGEGLVSNMLDSDSIIVDSFSGEIKEYSVAKKISRIVPTESGTEIQPVNEGINSRLLSNAEVQYITKIIDTLEIDSGYPIDVEFAIDASGKLWILQRRAITTLDNTASSESSSSVYVEKENNIYLVAEEISEKDSRVFSIAHPDISEPVNVYYKGNKDNVIIMSVSPEYESLIKREDFLKEFTERINSDNVVFEELRTNVPMSLQVKAGEIGLLEFFPGTLSLEEIVKERSYSAPGIKEMLSAA